MGAIRSRASGRPASGPTPGPFIPEPEVDEYHSFTVHARAEITFAAAKELDLQASPFVKGIFRLRSVPSLLRGEPFRPQGSSSSLDETLAGG